MTESQGLLRYWPDSQIDTLVDELVDTALYHPELASLKLADLLRCVLLIQVLHQYENQLDACVTQLDGVIVRTLS
jgi:hypothetical protein